MLDLPNDPYLKRFLTILLQILLDSLTQPGGVRNQPPKEDLQHFVEAIGSMDGLKMAELMSVKLVSARVLDACVLVSMAELTSV
jgi:hypothetical protein